MSITPGFLLGIAIGLLLAPTPGDETRERLNDRTRGLRDRARKYWDES